MLYQNQLIKIKLIVDFYSHYTNFYIDENNKIYSYFEISDLKYSRKEKRLPLISKNKHVTIKVRKFYI